VEGQKGFFNRRFGIPAVNLIEVDVVRAQTLQGRVNGAHQVLAREPAIVRVLAHRVKGLGGYDYGVTACEVAHRPAKDLLGHAAGVHVRRVEEVDAVLERLFEEGPAGFLGQDPGAPRGISVRHRPEADAGDSEAGLAKRRELHSLMVCDG
jgi:hypothetical protein